ncbi:hypothetical protein PAMP_024323 [Pampus punctatissimus]
MLRNLTPPHFSTVLLPPLLSPPHPFTPPTPIPFFFLSHVESIISCLVERESKHPRPTLRASRVGVGGCGEAVGICVVVTLSLSTDAVWTKGGLVISGPQHLIADRLHPPTLLGQTRPWLNEGEGDKQSSACLLTLLCIVQKKIEMGGDGDMAKGLGKKRRHTAHAHQRSSSDAASLDPALCSAMSGELAGAREGGHEGERKSQGGGCLIMGQRRPQAHGGSGNLRPLRFQRRAFLQGCSITLAKKIREKFNRYLDVVNRNKQVVEASYTAHLTSPLTAIQDCCSIPASMMEFDGNFNTNVSKTICCDRLSPTVNSRAFNPGRDLNSAQSKQAATEGRE